MEGIVTDVRLALRGLRRSPGFTAAAVLILALGIGANVTAFGALQVAVLGEPPFPDAGSLVSIDFTRGVDDERRYTRWAYPYFEMLEDWEGRLVDPIAAYRPRSTILTERGPARQVSYEIVSPDYFEVAGVPMALGREFYASESEPGSQSHVAVVSHSFWLNVLGGDASALHEEIRLDGTAFRVVGVAGAGFSGFGGGAELWLPHGAYDVVQPGLLGQPYNHQAWVVGRLRPGVSVAAADGQMRAIGAAVAEQWPRPDPYAAGARSLTEVWANPGAKTASSLLTLAAVLVLLVACANLSGLLLTRARRRAHEGAIRRALGASRWRLVRSLLAESFVATALGGVAGVMVAAWGMRLLRLAWPGRFLGSAGTGLRVADPDAMTLDGGTIAFAVALSIAAALLIGVLPALRASGKSVEGRLKDGGRSTIRGRRLAGTEGQSLLVAAQVSLALMLLVAVGLVGTSVARLLAVDEGFRTERLLTFDYSRPAAVPRLDPRDEQLWRSHIELSAQFDDRLIQRLAALPGVEAVTVSAGPALGGYQAVLGVAEVEGWPDMPGAMSIGVNTVADQYFETLGIPVLEGRGFTPSDGLLGAPAVVLSETAASTFFADRSPIGRRIGIGFALPGRATAEVVGVVGDTLYTGPDQEGLPVAYFSTRERRHGSHAMVRTTRNPSAMIASIRDELHSLDASVAMSDVATVDELVGRSMGDRRLIIGLLAVFTVVSVALAAVGTWGVVAAAVTDRRRELGLRIAVGADSRSVVLLVIRNSAVALVLGVGVGLGGAWAGTRILESFLWETSPRDPVIFVLGALLLSLVVLFASWMPARRATRVDPLVALNASD